jgi:hypothetical protein
VSPVEIPPLDMADVAAACYATGDEAADAGPLGPGGDLSVIVPSDGCYGLFAATLTGLLADRQERDGGTWAGGAAAALEILARASSTWHNGALIVDFPGVKLAPDNTTPRRPRPFDEAVAGLVTRGTVADIEQATGTTYDRHAGVWRGPCICEGRGHGNPACPWYGTDGGVS